MIDIWEQFDKATKGVSVFAVMQGEKYIGRLVFKHPADDAGRLYCYAHVFGAAMVRGHANGYGYDKKTAACEGAVAKMFYSANDDVPSMRGETNSSTATHIKVWQEALRVDDGSYFNQRLMRAGYDVHQIC